MILKNNVALKVTFVLVLAFSMIAISAVSSFAASDSVNFKPSTKEEALQMINSLPVVTTEKITYKPSDTHQRTASAVGSRSSYVGTISQHRGSFLMWSETGIDWCYNGSTISWVEPTQDSGFVFPNTIREKGASTKNFSSSQSKVTSKYIFGAGVVSPWGDVNVYESVMTDIAYVYGSGSYSWD